MLYCLLVLDKLFLKVKLFIFVNNNLDTTEGTVYFDNFGDAVYHLIVLQTTSNFPDVMMDIVAKFRFSCIFFIAFLVCNFLLLYNMIIGVYYLHYK